MLSTGPTPSSFYIFTQNTVTYRAARILSRTITFSVRSWEAHDFFCLLDISTELVPTRFSVKVAISVCLFVPSMSLFNGVEWRLPFEEGIPYTEELFFVCDKNTFLCSIYHQTSRSRITKPPGTLIACETAYSGQVKGDK